MPVNVNAVDAANQHALEQAVACRPRLVGVKPAADVVPGMGPHMVLHAAPPERPESLAPQLRAALRGAAELEGFSLPEAMLTAAQGDNRHDPGRGGRGSGNRSPGLPLSN
jgi:hypothetical protein